MPKSYEKNTLKLASFLYIYSTNYCCVIHQKNYENKEKSTKTLFPIGQKIQPSQNFRFPTTNLI